MIDLQPGGAGGGRSDHAIRMDGGARYTSISACRICGSTAMEPVLDLGEQMLTGVFPKARFEPHTVGPLRLVKCVGDCGLLQLEHSYALREMYGENYGYRSGLNPTMVAHLVSLVQKAITRVALEPGDLVVDIGSNDGTTLSAYPRSGLTLVGIDPTGAKFRQYYRPDVELIPDFFSSRVLEDRFPGRKAKIITSIAMFYDLEQPLEFARQVRDVLHHEGIWVFEQSYMPAMLERTAYDTVCHEHLEFYGLRQIKWMFDQIGLRIVDVTINDVNGGSFCVTAAKSSSSHVATDSADVILAQERGKALSTLAPYADFAARVVQLRGDLLQFIQSAHSQRKRIAGLGASTKGNVILQYCQLTDKDVRYVGEVNEDKFGRFMPGTWIPIMPEEHLSVDRPDFILVLPWHFREFFLKNKSFPGSRLVFPLPHVEIV